MVLVDLISLLFGGQGEQVMTTKDGEDCYQVKINLEKLQDESVCPTNCWTSDRMVCPRWNRLRDSDSYEQGVTKNIMVII